MKTFYPDLTLKHKCLHTLICSLFHIFSGFPGPFKVVQVLAYLLEEAVSEVGIFLFGGDLKDEPGVTAGEVVADFDFSLLVFFLLGEEFS